MGFDRDRLPAALDFYAQEGLKVSPRGKWRTANCVFHGGSDSLRINTHSGGWICMSCRKSGGDVLAYRMAAHGESFITAAKALGAWVDDGKPAPRRPTPLPPRDALQLLGREANLVAVAAGNLAYGVNLTPDDLDRVLKAAGRINRIVEIFA